MSAIRARWVVPQAGTVIENGWVSAEDGSIVDVGRGRPPAGTVDLGDVVVLPGLVNTHTHLELSWLEGRVPPAESMTDWIRALLRLRRVGPAGGEGEIQAAICSAIDRMRATGTVLVGDVTNSLAAVSPLAESGMAAVVFHEVLGFRAPDARTTVRDAQTRLQSVRSQLESASTPSMSVVAHAPYSTSPELFREIASAHEGPAPLSVHIAESNDEMEFLRTGSGPMRDLLESLDVWTPDWTAPGAHPLQYLRALGYLRSGTLLVHGVHLSVQDLDEAREAGAVVVTCPRSNVWVGGGVPPLARFFASGVEVVIGTDSLASVESLNMFDELAALRRLAPEVEAARLIDSATRAGAQALGCGAHYGRLAPGYRSTAVKVACPATLAGAADVEEYLVSGVSAAAVSPVDVAAL